VDQDEGERRPGGEGDEQDQRDENAARRPVRSHRHARRFDDLVLNPVGAGFALLRELGLLPAGEQLAVLDLEHVVVAREPGELDLDAGNLGRALFHPGETGAQAVDAPAVHRRLGVGLAEL
jgi:hypothetical protein